MEPTDAAALAGTPYRFIRALGHGGMSSVVEAEHVGLAQRVVVKLLRAELSARNDLIERLRLEAQALARLAHPNLVRVSDFGLTPAGRAYLVMELLEGKTIGQELRARGVIPVAEAIDWLRQVLAGLHAAHSVGLVHRDVKPENLFLVDGSPRSIRVLDFGIAKLSADAALSGVQPLAAKTHEGVTIGTPLFTAPEQIQGGLVTPSTDVYAAGLVLYELVVGKHPFADRRTTDAIYHAQLVEMPPPPSHVAPQPLPPALDSIVLRAIAKSPNDRFSSAEAFARALELLLSAPYDATIAAESRQAQTLMSEAPTLGSSDMRPAPNVEVVRPPSVEVVRPPNVEVVRPPSAVDAATVRLSPIAPPTQPATEPPLPVASIASPPKSESLGVLSIVLGLIVCFSQATTFLYGLRELVDPLASVPTKSTATEDAETLARIGAGIGMLKGLAISVAFLALIAIGVALVRRAPSGPRWARIWSTWTLLLAGFGVLIDIVVLGFRGPMMSDMFESGGVATSIGWAFGIAILIGLTAIEVLVIVGIRVWAGRLERRSSA